MALKICTHLIIWLSFLFSTSIIAQQPNILWEKTYGGSQWDYAHCITPTLDGNYIIAGNTNSIDGDLIGYTGSPDIWIIKIDTLGNIIWSRAGGDSLPGVAMSVDATADSGFIVGGFNGKFWFLKLDTAGIISWQKSFGGTYGEEMKDIHQTLVSGYIAVGNSYSNNGNVTGHHGLQGDKTDIWVVKTDSNGNLLWQKSIGGTGWDDGYSVQQTIDGGFIIAATTSPVFGIDGDIINTGYHGYADAFIIKLDSLGSIEWKKCYGGSASDGAEYIIPTQDGGYLFVGSTTSIDGDVSGVHSAGVPDVWVVKIDSSGILEWQKCYGGTFSEECHYVSKSSAGYLVTAITVSNDGDVSGLHWPNQPSRDYWIFEIDSSGGLIWQKCLGGSCADEARCALMSDSSYIIAGTTPSSDGDITYLHDTSCSCPGLSCGDIWIVKLSLQADGISNPEETLDLAYFHYSNHKGFLSLKLFSPKKESSFLRIIDICGREMLRYPINISKGENEFEISTPSLPTGIYFINFGDDQADFLSKKIIIY